MVPLWTYVAWTNLYRQVAAGLALDAWRNGKSVNLPAKPALKQSTLQDFMSRATRPSPNEALPPKTKRPRIDQAGREIIDVPDSSEDECVEILTVKKPRLESGTVDQVQEATNDLKHLHNHPSAHVSELGQEADEHAFQRPGPNDIRGPCPGLNLLANHGYCKCLKFSQTMWDEQGADQRLCTRRCPLPLAVPRK